MEIEDNIRRSDEIQDIIGQIPPWIIRWGAVIISMVFLVLVGAAIVIKYPDVIDGDLVITSNTPPVQLVAQADGRVNLLVKDNASVEKGQYVAYIENTTPLNEVINLKKELNTYQKLLTYPFALILDSMAIAEHSNLGQLQNTFNEYKSACDQYILFNELNENQQKIAALNKQLQLGSEHKDVLIKKRTIYAREHQIAQRQYKIDKDLFAKNAISQIELDKSEEKTISVLDKKHTIDEEIIKQEKELARITATIDELLGDSKEELKKLEFNITATLNALNAEFDLWEKKYVIVAPFKGKISFYDFWTNDQYVKSGSNVAYVITPTDHTFARLQVKGNRFGEVKKGQKVRIILDSYSAAEYGYLYGTVNAISDMNAENLYNITVLLNNGLITNYDYNIKFMPEMKGRGEIITKDMNILERCFYKVIKAFDRRSTPAQKSK